jgi:hypothetical protein
MIRLPDRSSGSISPEEIALRLEFIIFAQLHPWLNRLGTGSGFRPICGTPLALTRRMVIDASSRVRSRSAFGTPTGPDVLPGTFDPTFITTAFDRSSSDWFGDPLPRRDLDDLVIVARKRRIRLPIAVRGTCRRLLRHSGEASLCSVRTKTRRWHSS